MIFKGAQEHCYKGIAVVGEFINSLRKADNRYQDTLPLTDSGHANRTAEFLCYCNKKVQITI